MNYERKLKQSREEIVKELEKDHTNTVQLLKLQIFEQSKRYQLEISEIEDQVEKKYKDIIKNIKAQFEKEKNEIHMENLKMVAEIQDLCKKKIVHVENQLAAIKQNFVNEGDLLRQKLEKKDVEINGLHAELGKLNKDFIAAGNLISSLKVEKKRLENEFALIIDSKSNFFEERENELYEKFETDQKNALAKVYGEKAEMEKSMEKALQSANDRFDALSIRFKLLENKKRDIYQREINQTVLRLAQEITEKNKYIDNLCKELAKIKVQLKYTGDTMRIFTMEKVVTATHKKSISENFSTVHRQRPSSVGPNKTFKF